MTFSRMSGNLSLFDSEGVAQGHQRGMNRATAGFRLATDDSANRRFGRADSRRSLGRAQVRGLHDLGEDGSGRVGHLGGLLPRVINQRAARRMRPRLVLDADPCHVWAKLFTGDIPSCCLLNGWATFIRDFLFRIKGPLMDCDGSNAKRFGNRRSTPPLAEKIGIQFHGETLAYG